MLLQCYYRRFQPEQIKSIFLFSSSTTFLNDLNVEKEAFFNGSCGLTPALSTQWRGRQAGPKEEAFFNTHQQVRSSLTHCVKGCQGFPSSSALSIPVAVQKRM